jgi:hypothetical protein
MKKAIYIAPTTEELYALEKRARQERAQYVSDALASAATTVKSFLARSLAVRAPKEVRHA